MHEKNAWSLFIDATSGGDLNTAIAAKVGVDPATIGRWRTGAVDPKPRQVVVYARAYNLNPISALIGAGFLTAEELEIEVAVPQVTLADFTVEQLADELAARLRGSSASRGVVGDLLPSTTDIGDEEPHIPIA